MERRHSHVLVIALLASVPALAVAACGGGADRGVHGTTAEGGAPGDAGEGAAPADGGEGGLTAFDAAPPTCTASAGELPEIPIDTILPSGIAIADFDGDGKLDVATVGPLSDGHGNGGVAVALGHGDGTFGPAVLAEIAPGSMLYGPTAQGVATGDFDGDGKLDLATANPTFDDVSVAHGNGDGTFAAPASVTAGSAPAAVVAADLDGDGKLDLATANAGDGTVSVMIGHGDGTFAAPVSYPAASMPDALLAADVDGDGRPDLIVLGNGAVLVLKNTGGGALAAPISTPASGATALAAGDVTGDGHLDLVCAGPSLGVALLRGAGDGTFQADAAAAAGQGPSSVAVADVDGDGKLDAIAVGSSPSLTVLRGQGAAGLAAPTAVGLGVPSTLVAAGNLTGHGLPDLILANTGGPLRVLADVPGAGYPAWPGVKIPLGATPVAMTFGDFDGDGKLDLAVATGSSIGILLGTPSGGVGLPTFTVAGLSPQALAAGDLDGDHAADLVAADANAGLAGVFFHTQGGALTRGATYPTGGTPQAVALVDLDGDGKLDLAVANLFGTGSPADAGNAVLDGNVGVLLGHGDGTFAPVVNVAGGIQPTALTTGHFTPDGRLALVSASITQITLTFVDSTGALTTQVGYHDGAGVGPPPDAVVAADFDGDGNTDLAVVSGPFLKTFRGFGDGTFDAPISLSLGVGLTDLLAADLNADGKIDLAGTDSIGSVLVLVNQGGTFPGALAFPVGDGPAALALGPSWLATANRGEDVSLWPIPCGL